MYTNLEKFHRSLRTRGLNQEKLAALIGTGRPHLSEVLNNKPGHGHLTRRRLFPHLTPEEVRLLGWLPEYRRWLATQKTAVRSTENFVPTTA